jgi:hypothetical protein
MSFWMEIAVLDGDSQAVVGALGSSGPGGLRISLPGQVFKWFGLIARETRRLVTGLLITGPWRRGKAMSYDRRRRGPWAMATGERV